MSAYLALTKPRITVMVLVCTWAGYYFGATSLTASWTLFWTLAGTALMASGTAALNQWYESATDALMRRTAGRPVASGRIGRKAAFSFALLISAAGFALLLRGANPLAAGLCLFTLLSYLLVYTPLKRRSPACTTVGAIPGAMPPLIGYAAAAGRIDAAALALFAILLVWQFPHFYAIAWLYRDDYARAGIRMLPVVEPDGKRTARRIVACSLLLVPVSLLPPLLGMAGPVYALVAIVCGLLFCRSAYQLGRLRTLLQARRVLLASVCYLPVLFAVMMLDRAFAR